jgi:hypothetical protein
MSKRRNSCGRADNRGSLFSPGQISAALSAGDWLTGYDDLKIALHVGRSEGEKDGLIIIAGSNAAQVREKVRSRGLVEVISEIFSRHRGDIPEISRWGFQTSSETSGLGKEKTRC